MESNLSGLQRDHDTAHAESLQLESSQRESEDRLRVSWTALLTLQQELAIRASLSEVVFRARAEAEAICLQNEGVHELERQLLRLAHVE